MVASRDSTFRFRLFVDGICRYLLRESSGLIASDPQTQWHEYATVGSHDAEFCAVKRTADGTSNVETTESPISRREE